MFIISICWLIGLILYNILGIYHILGNPLYYLLWFYLVYRIEYIISWLKKYNLWKNVTIICMFFLVCIVFIINHILNMNGFELFCKYTIYPFLMLIILNFYVRYINIKSNCIYKISEYCMGIYLYAEPLNYLILWLFYKILGIEYFGVKIISMCIYLSRIIITPIIAIGITWILKKLHVSYMY